MNATEYKEKVNALLDEMVKLTEEQLNSKQDGTMRELILRDIRCLRARCWCVINYDMV